VQLDDVRVRIGPGGQTFLARDRAGMTVNANEFVALGALSRRGKSTILELVTGPPRPTESSIHGGRG
jgi:ABC-type nitrate/sulfonate/bicarbonate transport system ATPase subunit